MWGVLQESLFQSADSQSQPSAASDWGVEMGITPPLLRNQRLADQSAVCTRFNEYGIERGRAAKVGELYLQERQHPTAKCIKETIILLLCVHLCIVKASQTRIVHSF